MAIYAIGDIQGCYTELQKLLDLIKFSPENDTLWFAGDLVNRGSQSLETLRFIKSLGTSAITVLGNHDLHALAVRAGLKKDKHNTLSSLIKAHDADELFYWLRQQAIIHHNTENNFTMVHAGIPAHWNLKQAIACGNELHEILSGDNFMEFLEHMYGDKPDIWQDDLKGWDRIRYICNAFTRMRYCYPNGRLNLIEKQSPEDTRNKDINELIPWFEMLNRKTQSEKIIFGHWSTLGLRLDNGIHAIDTGCLWGNRLTALKIDDKLDYFQIECPKPEYKNYQ